MSKVLMKGNEAIGEAAIRAGCLNYFAYPITPCNRRTGFYYFIKPRDKSDE